jgi:hypothetical protein
MTKLTDFQLLILSKASQRADRGAAIPSNAKGGSTPKAVGDLLADGLLEELRAKDTLPVWRSSADNLPMALRITPRGLKAIRVEDTISQAGPSNTLGAKVVLRRGRAKSVASKTKVSSRSPRPSKLPAAGARNAGSRRALAKATRPKPKPAQALAATTASTKRKPNPTGRLAVTKQDAILVLLRRPKGATIADLMKTTNWQAHSVRGFLAGTVRKKLGLKLASDKLAGERTYHITGGRPSRKA